MIGALERASATIFIITMAANAVNYLFQLISGRALSVADFGELNYLFSLINIVNIPLSAIGVLSARDMAGFNAVGDASGLSACARKTLLLAFTYSAGLFTALTIIRSMGLFLRTDLALLLALSVFGGVALYLAQGLKLFFLFSLAVLLAALFKLLGAFASFGISADVRLLFILRFTLISSAASSLIIFLVVKRKTPALFLRGGTYKFSPGLLSRILVINAVSACIANADILYIRNTLDGYRAGLYSVVALFGKIILYGAGAVGAAVLPIVSGERALGENSGQTYVKALCYTVSFILGAVLIMFLARSWMITLFFGQAYTGAEGFLIYACAYNAVAALCALNTSYLLAANKIRPLIIINVLCCALCAVIIKSAGRL